MAKPEKLPKIGNVVSADSSPMANDLASVNIIDAIIKNNKRMFPPEQFPVFLDNLLNLVMSHITESNKQEDWTPEEEKLIPEEERLFEVISRYLALLVHLKLDLERCRSSEERSAYLEDAINASKKLTTELESLKEVEELCIKNIRDLST